MSQNDLNTMLLGMVCNVSCALLGCYLLLRRLSLLGDAISHGVLPGIALGFLLIGTVSGWAIFLGAVLFGMLTAFLTQWVTSSGKVNEDASLGVTYVSLFALGVILITRFAQGTHLDPDCVLEGELGIIALKTTKIAGVRVPEALLELVPVLLLTVGFITLFWKELKIVSFDPALATAMGLRAGWIHYLLMGMVAGVTVASFEVVGSILVIAMLIVPGATAHLLTDRLGRMLWIAAGVGALSAILGCLAALWINSNEAGMMAVMAGAQFGVAVLLAPHHGLVSKAIRNLRLRLRILREDVLAQTYRAEEAHQRGERDVPALLWEEARAIAPGLNGQWILRQLQRRNLMRVSQSGQVELTESGRARAKTVVRAHRLWEAFLEEKLNLPLDHLHEPAHVMEHFVGPDLQRQLEEGLQKTEEDPHGRSIPSLEEKARSDD